MRLRNGMMLRRMKIKTGTATSNNDRLRSLKWKRKSQANTRDQKTKPAWSDATTHLRRRNSICASFTIILDFPPGEKAREIQLCHQNEYEAASNKNPRRWLVLHPVSKLPSNVSQKFSSISE